MSILFIYKNPYYLLIKWLWPDWPEKKTIIIIAHNNKFMVKKKIYRLWKEKQKRQIFFPFITLNHHQNYNDNNDDDWHLSYIIHFNNEKWNRKTRAKKMNVKKNNVKFDQNID